VNRFVRGNWGLKLLSLLMAIVLWVYVANEQNPPQEREFKAVAVETRGLGRDMTVLQVPGTVNIRVQASRNVVTELSLRSVEAYIDLSGAKPGRKTVPVIVKVPPDVKVTGLTPKEVAVTLDVLKEKQVPVKASYTGKPAEGYKVLTIRPTPDEVILRGPQSILDTIMSAGVDVILRGKTKTFGETVPVKLTDRSGNFLEEGVIKRTPQVVNVTVTIVEDKYSKTVQVTPEITGNPAEGFVVTETVLEPATLVITGDRKLVEGLTQVATQPVDISNAVADVNKDVTPILPTGVIADRQSVRVLVKLAPSTST